MAGTDLIVGLRDRRYRVERPWGEPPPGIDIDVVAGVPATRAAEAMAMSRTPVDRPSLLWPLDLSPVASAPPGTEAWLLLRAAAGPRRASSFASGAGSAGSRSAARR